MIKAVARGGATGACAPPFSKKKNKKNCRIIRFYTNNPKCQYVYLPFYLDDYQIIDKVNTQYSGVNSQGRSRGGGVPQVHVHPPLGLKRPPDPSPNNFAPPISKSWLRPCWKSSRRPP